MSAVLTTSSSKGCLWRIYPICERCSSKGCLGLTPSLTYLLFSAFFSRNFLMVVEERIGFQRIANPLILHVQCVQIVVDGGSLINPKMYLNHLPVGIYHLEPLNLFNPIPQIHPLCCDLGATAPSPPSDDLSSFLFHSI